MGLFFLDSVKVLEPNPRRREGEKDAKASWICYFYLQVQKYENK